MICKVPPPPNTPLVVPRTKGMLAEVIEPKKLAAAVAPSSTRVPAEMFNLPAPVVKAEALAFDKVSVPRPVLVKPPVVPPESAPAMLREELP